MRLLKGVLSFLLIFSFSCGNHSDGGSFSKDGLSFTYPSGWSIIEQEDIDGEGYYLSVEKSGFNSSGILCMTWIYNIIDPYEYLEIIKDEYRSNKIFKNLKYSSTRNNIFNEFQSISSDFEFNNFGLQHRGVIHIFVNDGITYSVVKQEALEDISKNKKGFEFIESTFKID